MSCISCKGFIFLSWIHVQFYIKFSWFVELNVLGSFVLFLFFFVILWTKVDAKEQNEQVFNIDTMTQSKNTIFMLFSNLFLFSLTLLFSQKPYSAPLLICKFAPSLIRFQHLHKSKRKKWGNGTIQRICLHIVCYSYYVRTTSLKLDVRNTTVIRNLLFAYASLHFTGITVNFMGNCFLFFSVGQIWFKLEFNARVPLKKIVKWTVCTFSVFY